MDVKPFKFILIDFDGTLVDSIPLLFSNYLNFLKKYEKEGNLEEFQSLMGPSIEEFIPIIKERHQLSSNLADLIEVYTQGLAERYEKEAQLIAGAKSFLDYIKTLGLTMVLVTSTSHVLIERCLEQLDLKQYFSFIITGEMVKKTKPDPEIYLLALKTCTSKPQQALVIEDSLNGILAALGAGLKTIALKNSHLKKVPESVFVVDTWHDLLTIFKNAYEK